MAAAPGLKSRTTVLLEGTSQYLSETERERIEKKCAGFATPRSIASHATFDGRLRRGFGLAPWHRRNSHESVFSATSSIRQLLMGKNPAATPNLDGKYVDANGDLFERGTNPISSLHTSSTDSSLVDLCSPDPRDPTCLPSVFLTEIIGHGNIVYSADNNDRKPDVSIRHQWNQELPI